MLREVTKAIEAAAAAYPAWRRTPPEDRIQPLFKLKKLLEEHIDELSRIITQENGKTFARSQSRTAPRHRECRSRLRHSHDDAGLQPRRRRSRHRRDHDPPATRSRGRDHAVQFSRHDSVLVSALRDRVRKYFDPEAVRARAAHDASRIRVARADGIAAGRSQSRQRRQDGGGRAARSSQSPRHQLRGIDAGREIHLCARRRERQTRPVPGRRQEPCHRASRRRHEDGDADHRRQRLRMRWPALPGGVRCGHRRRSAEDFSRFDHRALQAHCASATAWTKACRWAR